MEQSLDDVLNGAEPGTVEAEIADVEVKEEPEQVEPKGEPEREETPEKEPAAVEKPATENEEDEPWTKKAYLDEKRKRQERERELEELRAQKEPEKVPDIFEDQNQYTDYVKNSINSAVSNTKAEMSEYYARREFGSDVVDEKFEKFKAMAEENPQLKVEVAQSISPWHTMVERVEAAEKLEQMKDLPAYEAKVRAEIEAKVRAELEGKQQAESDKLASLTPSLAGKRASGSSKDPIEQSLEEILGR